MVWFGVQNLIVFKHEAEHYIQEMGAFSRLIGDLSICSLGCRGTQFHGSGNAAIRSDFFVCYINVFSANLKLTSHEYLSLFRYDT